MGARLCDRLPNSTRVDDGTEVDVAGLCLAVRWGRPDYGDCDVPDTWTGRTQSSYELAV